MSKTAKQLLESEYEITSCEVVNSPELEGQEQEGNVFDCPDVKFLSDDVFYGTDFPPTHNRK